MRWIDDQVAHESMISKCIVNEIGCSGCEMNLILPE